jgi:hypothetical protein
MQLIDGIKRLIYGSTTHFEIKQGSTALNGTSFVELYKERLEYPISVVSFEMKCESKNKAEFRFLSNGTKIFPFINSNNVPDTLVNIIPVDISAGSLFTIEVKGASPNDKFIVILSELDVIEKR